MTSAGPRCWAVYTPGARAPLREFPAARCGGASSDLVQFLRTLRPPYSIVRDSPDPAENYDIHFTVRLRNPRACPRAQAAARAAFAAEVASAKYEGLPVSVIAAAYGLSRRWVHYLSHKFA